jgi:hypothetical protein
MNYIILNETATPQKEGLIFKLLRKFLPLANPDYERLYQNVVTWYLEIDENGKITREIGMDHQEETIVIGPWGRNRGLWPDSPVVLEPKDYTSVGKTDFDEKWSKYIEKQKV